MGFDLYLRIVPRQQDGRMNCSAMAQATPSTLSTLGNTRGDLFYCCICRYEMIGIDLTISKIYMGPEHEPLETGPTVSSFGHHQLLHLIGLAKRILTGGQKCQNIDILIDHNHD